MSYLLRNSWVIIEDLSVDASIGVFDWERDVKQRLFFSLRLKTDMANAGVSDAIEDAISYAEVSEVIEQTTLSKHHDLLEHLGMQIMNALFERYTALEAIELIIKKPGAVPKARSVGVELHCQRSDLEASITV